MERNDEPRFQFYQAPVSNTRSRWTVTVADIYRYITQPTAMERTWKLRQATDERERRLLKSRTLDFACFSGTFSRRCDEGLIRHSGLLCLDLDHVGPPYRLWPLRQALADDRHFRTELLFTSPSGDGLKWVIRIDLAKGDHLTWFRALQNYVSYHYGYEVDEKCGNVSRACFLPHDPVCYAQPEVFNHPGICPF